MNKILLEGAFDAQWAKLQDMIDPELNKIIVGNSVRLGEIKFLIQSIATDTSNLIVLGDTGTGKEQVAHALHRLSRRDGPLVPIHCGGIPEGLIESELFGVIKNYPGMHNPEALRGAFERGLGGTIFLDELHQMTMAGQVKLLRVLEEKEFTPLGDSKPIKLINTRIIAAVKPNIEELIEKNLFLRDLYARFINLLPILPRLKDIREDIPFLIDHFLKIRNSPLSFTKNAIFVLQNHEWRENIRELRNFIDVIHQVYRPNLIYNIDTIQVEYVLYLIDKRKKEEPRVYGITQEGLEEKNIDFKIKEYFLMFIAAIGKKSHLHRILQDDIVADMGITKEYASRLTTLYRKEFTGFINSEEFKQFLPLIKKYTPFKKFIDN